MSRSEDTQLPRPVTAPGYSQAEHIAPAKRTDTSASLSMADTGSPSRIMDSRVSWKHEGYPQFSKLMASDDDLFVFRRFATVNARVILWLQHQITQKEERLEAMDDWMRRSEKGRNDSFTWDAQVFTDRDDLMRELSALVLHYNNYVEAFSRMRARPAAEPRQIENVKNWLFNTENQYRNAIAESETTSYTASKHAADLISISSRSRPPLGQWLESRTKLQLSGLFREKRVEGRHIEETTTIYSSNAKFEKVTNRTIIIGGLVMLLTPLWLLEYFAASKVKLGIITAFVIAFMWIMSTATINRPFEVVAASAAYAAVLMVFMQIQLS